MFVVLFNSACLRMESLRETGMTFDSMVYPNYVFR